jgi:hypothetical protein
MARDLVALTSFDKAIPECLSNDLIPCTPLFAYLPRPVAICLDPLRADGGRVGQRQVEDRDPLAFMTATTPGYDLASLREVNPFDRHGNAEHLRLKRKREVFLDHCEQPRSLLGFVVSVHCCLFNKALEALLAERPWGLAPLRVCCPPIALSRHTNLNLPRKVTKRTAVICRGSLTPTSSQRGRYYKGWRGRCERHLAQRDSEEFAQHC